MYGCALKGNQMSYVKGLKKRLPSAYEGGIPEGKTLKAIFIQKIELGIYRHARLGV